MFDITSDLWKTYESVTTCLTYLNNQLKQYFLCFYTSIFFKHLFFRNDKIFLITKGLTYELFTRKLYNRKIYEIVQKNDTVFLEFSRPFPYIERHLIFPQLITYKENEAFNFYPQYVSGGSTLNWSSIHLPLDIQDEPSRSYWIFRI